MKKLVLLFFVFTFAINACGGPSTPAPTPTPTPDEWLDRAAQAVLDLKSAQFSLLREGAPVVLDPATQITFSEATGKYQAPDRVSATAKITLLGNVVEIQMLWLPEGAFVSNPLTQTFQPISADTQFNGAALFRAEGLPAVLKDGIRNAAFVGAENIEELITYHLKGRADGAQLAALTAGALAAGTDYDVDVWLDPSSANLVRIHITEADGSGWTIELFAINEAVEIKAP